MQMERLSLLHVYADTCRVNREGEAGIRARQQARLAEMVQFARSHSRFYAERYRGLPEGVTDPRLLPVVTKAELMGRFDDWVTDPAVTRSQVEAFVSDPSRIGARFLGKYMVYVTSGTSGVPAMLIQDAGAANVMTMLTLARSSLSGAELWQVVRRGQRMGGVYATGGHFLSTAMTESRRRMAPWKKNKIRVFSALDPLPKLVAALNAFQPTLLGGYPTMLAVLAQEQLEGRLQISPVLTTCGGEGLTDEVRSLIKGALGGRVTQTYGCTESGGLTAYECKYGHLHVHADWFPLEPVDKEYRPVAPGQPSDTVLLTNLANRVQPIIRYDLGDRVTVLPGPCPCGSSLPVIRVEGRTDEMLRLNAPGGAIVQIPPLALFAVIKETPGMGRFQVIQTGPSRLDLRLEVRAGAERGAVWLALADRLGTWLGTQGLPGVALQLAAELPAPDARSGKFRHVWVEKHQ
jgi:phenylacetate-coenzyme A ligase PaaK-like adenylate-forming protein